MEENKVKTTIDIPDNIDLPESVNRYETANGTLYVAKEISSIVLTDEISDYIMQILMQDSNVDHAFFKASEYFEGKHSKEEVYKSFVRLIGQMNIEQFSPKTQIYSPSFENIEKGLHIYLTKTCNLRCIHCYNDADNQRYDEISYEQLKKVVDFFAPHVINYSFSGGEPMASPCFFQLADYIKSTYPDKTLTLYSNGTLIQSQEVANHISELFSEVQISIDGASAEIVNRVRGDNAFARIIRGLKYLVHTDKKIEELAISICLFKFNIDDLHDNLCDLLETIDPEKRIKSIRFSNIEEEGRGTQNMQYEKNNENFKKIVYLQRKINFSGRRIWERYQEQVLRNHFCFNKGFQRRVSKTCSFGQTLALDSNGDIYPCAIKKSDINMGNFFDESFQKGLLETWKKYFYDHTVDKMEKCSDCDIKHYCCAGCRIKNRKITGHYNVAPCDEAFKTKMLEKIAHDLIVNYSNTSRQILKLESTL
ncbi:radical SAM additional 4Fe4S-binding SPASM domain-containing protein [[Clostridium] polysaccharolyticum]|uniref:Radical SAM additional 4Fe4S-binding SPASM domain-containing protein n=2 Tax=[Clostridium] polysaccharolyticum TaxID=29364 RepID=A0A1I0ACI2_9FIRM|nr:radical SAM additional 4Fe4S-binding SPASM domain-containing protein [[Clostridium] polysaccharolyticum]